jgi:hypothetical protein
MAKLTLSIDEKVTERAKRYAKQNGTSVSSMVETYLDLTTKPQRKTDEEEDPPILKKLRGILKKKTSREDYRKYLVKKYL